MSLHSPCSRLVQHSGYSCPSNMSDKTFFRYQRYRLFSRYDEGIQMDYDGLYAASGLDKMLIACFAQAGSA